MNKEKGGRVKTVLVGKENIANLIDNSGSLRKVAEDMGTYASHLSKIKKENGIDNPTLKTLKAISKAFCVRLAIDETGLEDARRVIVTPAAFKKLIDGYGAPLRKMAEDMGTYASHLSKIKNPKSKGGVLNPSLNTLRSFSRVCRVRLIIDETKVKSDE